MGKATIAMLLAALGACDRPSSPAPPVASSAPALSVAPAPVPPPAPPADLDVDALKKKLACGEGTRRTACRILSEFSAASRFEPRIPSGEGRWVGYGYPLEKETKQPELILLSASQVPTATVPAGELALSVGTGTMPDDKRDHGVKLANALARGDTVPKTNAAAPYVKAWKPAFGSGTMNTSGTSVRLVAQEAYLRLARDKVLFIQLKPAKGGGPEGIAGELWAASW